MAKLLVQWTYPAEAPGFTTYAHKTVSIENAEHWKAEGYRVFDEIRAKNHAAELQLIHLMVS